MASPVARSSPRRSLKAALGSSAPSMYSQSSASVSASMKVSRSSSLVTSKTPLSSSRIAERVSMAYDSRLFFAAAVSCFSMSASLSACMCALAALIVSASRPTCCSGPVETLSCGLNVLNLGLSSHLGASGAFSPSSVLAAPSSSASAVASVAAAASLSSAASSSSRREAAPSVASASRSASGSALPTSPASASAASGSASASAFSSFSAAFSFFLPAAFFLGGLMVTLTSSTTSTSASALVRLTRPLRSTPKCIFTLVMLADSNLDSGRRSLPTVYLAASSATPLTLNETATGDSTSGGSVAMASGSP